MQARIRLTLAALILLVAAAASYATSSGASSAAFSTTSSASATRSAPCTERHLDRISGGSRITTAIAVSQRGWSSAPTVLVASAGDYPDALAGAALAADRDAPTLLTHRDSLPNEVGEELQRLDPSAVLITGGSAAVSDAVERRIREAVPEADVGRVAGEDRYATAAAVVRAAGPASVAAVASGQRFADAVSAGALAATPDQVPVLLTPSDYLHDEVAPALRDLGVDTVRVVGGSAAVDEAVVEELREEGFAVQRLAGANRYETSAAVAREAAQRFGEGLRGAVLATGSDFPDALTAASLAARTAGVLAIVPTGGLALPDGIADLLDTERDRLDCNAIVGGSAAVGVRVAEMVASHLVLAPPDGPPVLIGAGDIAVCGFGGDEATADVVETRTGTVATFGDNAYDRGTHREFSDCYTPSWGRFQDRTRPSPGNHDYGTEGAAGYFDYFGPAAGQPGEGWYSYDLGPWWHVIALNSNCWAVGGCGAGSPQERWLREDLTANTDRHVIAYWHHPRWSSGQHGSSTATAAFWDALYEYGAEIVLAGHDHNYERFSPMAPDGSTDEAHGIRSFVVGTGGTYLRSFGDSHPPLPTTEVRDAESRGVLQLTLRQDGFDWRLLPAGGGSFTDHGTGGVHGAP